MAPKNLLPVAALCSALASGTPLAAWATPATANSLPQALNPVANSSGIVACQRFSLARATVRTSGCLHRNTVDSIVVDIKRPDKENGPQTGYAICTWKSAAVDADGDPCDLELRIDIDSVDDSANGAKVVFDSAAYEEEGGGMPGLRSLECRWRAAHHLLYGIAATDQGGHRSHRNGRCAFAVLRWRRG